jgi:hypothetical protein
MEQNPYLGMIAVQAIDTGYEPPRYYWRDIEYKLNDNYSNLPPPPAQYTPQLSIVQRISGIIKSQLPMLKTIATQLPSRDTPRVELQSKRLHSSSHS